MNGEGGFSTRDDGRRQPTAEENALFAVMSEDADALDEALRDMLPGELRALYDWANTLHAEVWDQLGRPDMPRVRRLR